MDQPADAPQPAETSAEPSAEPAMSAPPTSVRRPPTAGGPWAWLVLAVIVALLAVTVGFTLAGGSSSSTAQSAGACAPTAQDPLDPSSSLRLLPNAPAPSYASNPPTSGAFQVGAQSAPVSTTELSPVVQVGLLAQGDVLIQYRDLESADVAALQSLAGDEVVVAPNSSLPAPIVATAWRKRRTCTTVDIDDLRQFATLNGNQGPTGRPLGTAASTTTTS